MLGHGADAIEEVVAALERLHPGAPLDDPGRLAADRQAKRARLAVLMTREDLAATEERIAATVTDARSRTGWRRRPA